MISNSSIHDTYIKSEFFAGIYLTTLFLVAELFSCNMLLSHMFSLVYNFIMNRLKNEQRLQIIEFYYQNSCSVKRVLRALVPIYGQFGRPTEEAIRKLVTKFRTKFTLLDIKPLTRIRRVRNEENIAAISASVTDDREMSIRHRTQQLSFCYSTTWKI